MDKNSDSKSTFLITGVKSDLVPYLDALEVPSPNWSPEPKVDWCRENFIKPKKTDLKIDLIELNAYPDVEPSESSSSEDWHIEIEQSDEENQPNAGMKKHDTGTPKYDVDVRKTSNKIRKLKNTKWFDVERTKQCPVCAKSYYVIKSLQDHLKEVHSAYNLVCEKCGQLFHSMRYFRRHILHHSKRKPLIEKNKAIEKLKLRKVDLAPLTENFKVKCQKCPAILLTKNALATHLRNVHSEGRFKCELCNSELKCKTYLHAHMRRVHSEEMVPCLLCGKNL